MEPVPAQNARRFHLGPQNLEAVPQASEAPAGLVCDWPEGPGRRGPPGQLPPSRSHASAAGAPSGLAARHRSSFCFLRARQASEGVLSPGGGSRISQQEEACASQCCSEEPFMPSARELAGGGLPGARLQGGTPALLLGSVSLILLLPPLPFLLSFSGKALHLKKKTKTFDPATTADSTGGWELVPSAQLPLGLRLTQPRPPPGPGDARGRRGPACFPSHARLFPAVCPTRRVLTLL